jgi:hypothetical protein
VLLVFGAPCQRNLLAGQEHGRTIPLPVKSRVKIPQCSNPLARSSPIRYALSTLAGGGGWNSIG